MADGDLARFGTELRTRVLHVSAFGPSFSGLGFFATEVVPFLHLEPFQGLDQLRRILAAAESRLLHSDLEGIHGLVVRLHVAVWQTSAVYGSSFSSSSSGSRVSTSSHHCRSLPWSAARAAT
jgi:hypothetical protein